MKQYHKIQTVYLRDPEKPKHVLEGTWSKPEFELLKDIEEWHENEVSLEANTQLNKVVLVYTF